MTTDATAYQKSIVAEVMALVDAYADTAAVNGIRSQWAQMARGSVEVALAQRVASASAPPAEAVPAQAGTYAEARECTHCNHVGINDSADGMAACKSCQWCGESPKEDKCPACKAEGTMTASCPKCNNEYSLIASDTLAATQPAAQGLEAAAEHQALRDVYEQARGVLRHDGVDQQRALKYRNGLIEAIEAVKAIDGGNWEAEAPMSDDDAAELILETMAVHCDKNAWHQAIEVHKVLLSRYVESAPQAQDVQDAEAVKAARNAGINHGVCLALQIMHAAGDAGSTQWNELLDTAGREEVTNYAKVIEPDEWVLCGFAQVAEWKAEFDAIAASAAKGGE